MAAQQQQGESEPLISSPFRHYDWHYESFRNLSDSPGPPPHKSRAQSIKHYFSADIDTRWADLILIVCFAICGLIDSGAYNAYECFVSMQTGNTIFAALGVSDLPVSAPKYAWTKSVCSILAFLLGAAVFGAFHRRLGDRKRWVLAFSFLVQAVMTAVAAKIVFDGNSPDSPTKKPSITGLPADPGFPWTDLIPISLLSFQAAGKVITSRVLGYSALPTIVLTTLYNDLASDPGLTAGLTANVGRNRRLAGAAFYFGGAVSGGALARSSLGLSGLLWITAGAKLAIVAAWLLWREDRGTEGERS